MRTALIAAGLVLSTGAATAQSSASAAESHAIIAFPGKITWGAAPAILPRGADLAVVEGDPSKPGEFTMRLRMPDGYRIPAHFHPVTEHVTVVQGTFRVGMGDKFEASALKDLPTGTFAALAPGMRHFAAAKGETVIQLHGVGPWSLTYVNPTDDPRKQRK
ncbi:MAG: cupin domain-containing protein [Gemmatimonadota bacterium]